MKTSKFINIFKNALKCFKFYIQTFNKYLIKHKNLINLLLKSKNFTKTKKNSFI